MTNLTVAVQTQPFAVGQRRSQRVLLAIPLEVAWTRQDGVRVIEHAQTEIVNRHGALLHVETPIPTATQVKLLRPHQGLSTPARVVGKYPSQQDGLSRIAVELSVPSEQFWGLSFPTR